MGIAVYDNIQPLEYYEFTTGDPETRRLYDDIYDGQTEMHVGMSAQFTVAHNWYKAIWPTTGAPNTRTVTSFSYVYPIPRTT